MQPEQKEDKILSYLTYSFLGVIMIILTVLMYRESRPSKVVQYEEPFAIPEVNVLTAEEVEIERTKVIVRDNAMHPSPPAVEREIEPSAISVRPIQENTESDNRSNIIERPVITKVNSDGSLVYTTERKSIEEYNTLSSVNISDFKAREDKGEKMTAMTIKGLVYSIDFKNNHIIISQDNGMGFALVRIDSDTKIEINSKAITLADIKVGDKVLSEGLGFPDTADIQAKTVIITGALKLIQ